MTNKNKAILACLQEVDNSRPYFVGMLGERYGWNQVTDGKDASLTKTFEEAELFPEYVAVYSFLLS